MECGHMVNIACSKVSHFNIQHCSEKCNEVLKCGHICKGTCGKCHQGRLHVRCFDKKCNKKLFCGHPCEEKCDSVCPPCQKKCENSCKHSKCGRICSEPCRMCEEPCEWKCPHYVCTRKCSEPCDRPMCNEPCPKILACQHPCTGFCGEPCPKLCRVCDKKKIKKLFPKLKDIANTRFVQLDCGHVFTSQKLDELMATKYNIESHSAQTIQLTRCPSCKKPLRTSRYGEVINETLMAMNDIRTQIGGSPEEVRECQKKIRKLLVSNNVVNAVYPSEVKNLTRALVSTASKLSLSMIEQQSDSLAQFSKIINSLPKTVHFGQVEKMITALKQRMEQVKSWLFRKRLYFTEQEKSDLQQEMQRCRDAFKLINVKIDALSLNLEYNDVETIDQCVESVQKYFTADLLSYNSYKQNKVKEAFESIEQLMPLNETCDSLERPLIVEFVDLSPGQWFKCKKGHLYCSSECFGMADVNKCPKCS